MKKTTVFVLSIALILGVIFVLPQKSKAYTWTQVNSNGFGSPNNWGTIRMFNYNGYIYVGAGNGLGAQMYRSSDGTTWDAVTTDGFGDAENNEFHSFASFGGYLYATTVEVGLPVTPSGLEVWRSTTGDPSTWTQFGTDGFGDADNIAARASIVFGNFLYVVTDNAVTGAQLWKTDGNIWLPVITNGFGVAANVSGRALNVFDNKLYVGLWNAGGGQMYRSDDGMTWDPITTDGFGHVHNLAIMQIQEFQGKVYCSTANTTDGAEIYSSSNGASGVWTLSNTSGFGDTHNTWIGYQGAVINNVYYIGTRTNSGGAELWQTSNGTDWTQEGAAGFGDTNNFALYAQTFNNVLYVGFSNMSTGTEIWRTNAGEINTLSFSGDLPSGLVGLAYSTTLTPSNGTPPFVFSVIGNLPNGLMLSSNGVLSGTPTRNGTFTFNICLIDSGTPPQQYCKDYTMIIVNILPESGVDLTNN